ncbi:hypothetical protein NPIL_591331 [Nephila pilipes]|uniref:Uncharacterized protein n=1 Tax=Nephila pilipes TaxID=299642 RepID=A0A8X6QU85_NEPPI|nr:hypothetical protein NPIL_591331 [Nephila pilipes]
MEQSSDSEPEEIPSTSSPLDLHSLTVYIFNQTTTDGTLEAISALRGQETNLNNINFPNDEEKEKYKHFLRELMEEATKKYRYLYEQNISYLNSIGLAEATQSFQTVSNRKKKEHKNHSSESRN